MRQKLIRFMAGRNGSDALTRFISLVVLALLIVSFIVGGEVGYGLWVLCIAGVVYCYFRIFSKSVYKRQEENRRFLGKKTAAAAYFRGMRQRYAQRKDYKFFRCPSCRTMLRVPRGKGRIKVVCRKCGTSFIKKT